MEGTYKIETDRQKNLQGAQALAAPYWEFFHFKLKHILNDDVDHSIFGAIFEYNFQIPHFFHNSNNSYLKPPQYVVAFRGTLIQPNTRMRDLVLDFQCIRNKIHESSRVQVATRTIQDLCSVAGHRNVWIAGHSLGSAIGLLAGKNMAKLGFPLETYLFNPPYISAPIESIKEERLRHGIRYAGSFMKAGLNAVVNGHHKKVNGSSHHHQSYDDQDQEDDQDDSFAILSSWFPYLFLNPTDMICSGYIGYFEHREKMAEIGAGRIGKLATKSSVESILSGSEPYDLVPSAFVAINMTPAPDLRRAHGLEQWWNPNFHYRSSTYQFSRWLLIILCLTFSHVVAFYNVCTKQC